MSDAKTSLGVAIYIGAAAPATFDKAGYEAVIWTEIGEVGNINGDIGKLFTLATYALLKTAGIIKRKSTFNNGAIQVEYAYQRTDTGQAAVVAAAELTTLLPFKITLTDVDTTHIYFMGLVMGEPINIGGSGDFITATVPIEIDGGTSVLKVAAPV